MKQSCLFHCVGYRHDACVTAQQFGPVWLVNDTETMYWTDQSAIDLAPEFDEGNYDAWCRATSQSVSPFGGSGYGIPERGSAEFLAACRAAEAAIEAVGGVEYAALVESSGAL